MRYNLILEDQQAINDANTQEATSGVQHGTGGFQKQLVHTCGPISQSDTQSSSQRL